MERYNKFIEVCNLKDVIDTSKLVVCSDHFSPSDILGNRHIRARLNPLAIPSRNLPPKPGETIHCPNDVAACVELSDKLRVVEEFHNYSASSHTSNNILSPPSLKVIAEFTVLPNSNWYLNLADDRLCFFDITVDTNFKTRVLHSVTFHKDVMSQPTIFINSVQLDIPPSAWIFQSIDDVSDLLQKIDCYPEMLSYGAERAADTLREVLDSNPDDSSILPVKFLHHQLQLLSAPCSARRRYDPALIRWCLLIHFHSPAAYKAILQSNFLLLPSERLLRTYSSPLTVNVGLGQDRMEYLQSVASKMNDLQKCVALIVDEMYIKSEVAFSGGMLHGYAENKDGAEAATTIVTVMMQSLCGDFRDIVSYYPVKQLTGDDETTYVRDAVVFLESLGMKVTSIICDNSKVNRIMMKNFGVEIADGIITFPRHPVDPSRTLYFIIDPCHLIKCIRNNWINKGMFKINDEDVSFEYIRRLFSEDQKRTVKLAPKLTIKVVSPTNTERQRVRLAANLFSSQICSALETYMLSNPVEFSGAMACINFIKKIKTFWNWSNIQNLYQGQHNRDEEQNAFTSAADTRFSQMDEMKIWLSSWNPDTTPRTGLTRETYSAFMLTLTALRQLTQSLLTDHEAPFVLTGRYQQDPLEERFGAHRQRAGCSYNPSALQFAQTEKKLSVIKFVLQNNNCNTTRIDRKRPHFNWNSTPIQTTKPGSRNEMVQN